MECRSGEEQMTRTAVWVAAVAACTTTSDAVAQAPESPSNWPMYSRDFAGTRYSPLTQITRRNVSRLEQAWSVPVARAANDDDAGGPSGNPQATPIVVDGVMYLPVRGHEVLALDAATGDQIWRTPLPTTEGTDARGVGYWPGDGQIGPRIFVMSGPTLVALDAASGAPARGFGRDGVKQVAVPYRGTPLIYGNLAIVGAYVGRAQSRSCRRYARLRHAHGRARLDVPHGAVAGRGRARNLARPRLAQSLRHQRLGLLHDARLRRATALCTCRCRAQPATIGAATDPAQSLQQLHRGRRCARRESTDGTSRPCITISGTSTCRTRPCSSTSSARVAACRR